MQPATIRRLLVFGVCLVGVGCLYLVPSMAGSSKQVGTLQEHDLTTTASNTTVGLSTAADVSTPDLTGVPTQITSIAPRSAAPSTGSTRTPAGQTGDEVRHRATGRAGATPAVPGRDEDPPDAVGRLTVVGSDPDRVTVSWPETHDDVGVVGYRVLLNGFFVLATQRTRATLEWFNDSSTHVIQVRALDAAGNEGPSSPTLLVTRPAPDPEPASPAASTPAAEPTVTASPTPTQRRDQTTDINDAAPSPTTTQQSSTGEESS